MFSLPFHRLKLAVIVVLALGYSAFTSACKNCTGLPVCSPPVGVAQPVINYYYMYVADKAAKIVWVYRLNPATGSIDNNISGTAQSGNGTFGVGVSPNGQAVVVSNQTDGTFQSYYTDNPQTGVLRYLNTVSIGGNPDFISFAPNSQFVIGANGTNLASYSLDSVHGLTLIQNAATGGPSFIGVAFNTLGNRFYTADFTVGGAVYGYVFNGDGTFAAMNSGASLSAGLGGSALQPTLHPTGAYLYVPYMHSGPANGGIQALKIAANGALSAINNISVAYDHHQLAIDPAGRFIYAIDATNNKIYGYTINQVSGAVTAMVSNPLANGYTNLNGIAVDPTGQYLFAVDKGAGKLYGFSISFNTGALIPLSGYPITYLNQPASIGFATIVFKPSF